MHKPVLLNEVVENLVTDKDGIYIDATFGRGGHSKEILKKLSPKAKLLAIDRDLSAICAAEKLQQQDARLTVRHGAFSRIKGFCDALNITGKVVGILLDLGASSPQFDEGERGFSFMREGPLDMRMDQTQELTAAMWLEKADAKEIASALWQYGDEKFSKRIARAIKEEQKSAPLITTTQLVAVIKKAVPHYERTKHPATRTFQALRIVVNEETNELLKCLEQSIEILKPGGRLVTISFHSLEEQIIKRFLRSNRGANLPRRLPIEEHKIEKKLRAIGKAISPTPTEVAQNPRARSAKLRIMEKIK